MKVQTSSIKDQAVGGGTVIYGGTAYGHKHGRLIGRGRCFQIVHRNFLRRQFHQHQSASLEYRFALE